ncbi:MAG: transposase [Acidobacteriota bacterium]|nr:transposase [Acidobacteriota bacterium]
MARPLLYVPPGGAVFELTSRTLHGRFLLRPGRQLNQILAGILGRAQRRYDVDIYIGAFLSNHFHLLARFETPHQLSGFMQYFKANLAKEAGRLYGWREKLWGRRYRPIQVSDEEAALVGRLRYILSQACKEGLVLSPLDWPGVNCARALTEGRDLTGLWYDRTKQFYARRQGEAAKESDFATRERVVLQQLPCWSHLSPEHYRSALADLIQEIEDETRRTHEEAGTQPLGASAILRQDPHQRPPRSSRSPAPRFHAATRKVRRSLANTYALVHAAYQRASLKLRRGLGPVEFPPGCFPPRLPILDVPYQLVPG